MLALLNSDEADMVIETATGKADMREHLLQMYVAICTGSASKRKFVDITDKGVVEAEEKIKAVRQELLGNIKDAMSDKCRYTWCFDCADFYHSKLARDLSQTSYDGDADMALGMCGAGFFVFDNKERRVLDISYINYRILLYILIKNGFMEKIREQGIQLDEYYEKLSKSTTFEEYTKWVSEHSNAGEVIHDYVECRYIHPDDNKALRKFYKTLATEIESGNGVYPKFRGEIPDEICNNEDFQKIIKKTNAEELIRFFMGMLGSNVTEYTLMAVAQMCRAYGLKVSGETRNIALIDTYNGLDTLNKYTMLVVQSQAKTIDAFEEKLGKAKDETQAIRTQYKKQRSSNKELIRQNSELIKKLTKRENDAKRQQEIIEELKSQGLTSSKPFEEEIHRLREELKRAKETAISLERANGRLKKEKNELNDKVRSLSVQASEASEKLKEVKRAAAENQASKEAVPIEAFVEAIKDKKITLVGGDTMHTHIQALGLNNVKFIKISNHSTPDSDIANSDLVVIITSFVSHVTSTKPKNVAIRYNIPLLYYNSTNVTGLVQEMFAALYTKQSD